MSNYSKVIIFIVILIVFSGAVIYLYGSENSMNSSMPDISSSIVNGDSNYNEAVDLVNSKNYDEARNKATSAENNYNRSINLLSNVMTNLDYDTNDVQKNYLNTIFKELELKVNATYHLSEAIDHYEYKENRAGNEYASEANDYMNQALEFQNSRNDLVKNNPNDFK